MSADDLSTYSEMADVLERLPQIVRDARRARGMSLRAVGRASGISSPALSQFENGHHTLGGAHTVRLLRWLDQTIDARADALTETTTAARSTTDDGKR